MSLFIYPMARPTKLTPQLQTKIVQLLKKGVTITDTCAHVGIAQSTYFDWIERGEAGETLYAEFSEKTARAHNDAKVVAIGTLRTAMSPFNQTSKRTETFTETRLNRKGEEYQYKRETVTKTITRMQGDWRAAIEFLKRRFPDEWSEKLNIMIKGDLSPEFINEVIEAIIAANLDPSETFNEMIRQAAAHADAADSSQ